MYMYFDLINFTHPYIVRNIAGILSRIENSDHDPEKLVKAIEHPINQLHFVREWVEIIELAKKHSQDNRQG